MTGQRNVKLLTDNLNSKHSNRNAFSRQEMYFGPARFLPNHRLFASDIFEVCNQMINEANLSHGKKIKESKRQSFNQEILKLSFPRNSIVKLQQGKGDKDTVNGSRKLLPDTKQLFQIQRSGNTQVQARNLSNNTIRTLKKQNIEMVTYNESQTALRLINNNFPKSLLWEYNHPHMKQSKQTYFQHITLKPSRKKTVRFSSKSCVIYLEDMYRAEQHYIGKYKTFSSFPQYLKTQRHKILKMSNIETKLSDGQVFPVNIFYSLQTCPATSSREISLLYPVLEATGKGLSYRTSDI